MSSDRSGPQPDTRHDSTRGAGDTCRLTAWLTGEVQGVGMRWWVRARALELGLVGSAANRPDGRVELVAEGSQADCEALLTLLRPDGATSRARPGLVTGLVERWDEPRGGLDGFRER
jgi:acylphosphatase